MLLGALLLAAATARPFHLTLEANPAAPFPFLGKFGNVIVQVYPHGVRAESLWLRGFSRNHAPAVTVEDPMSRTYSDVALPDIAATLHKLSGPLPELERTAPTSIEVTAGNVKGFAAKRFRMRYAPQAFIDVWTTDAFGDAPQYRALMTEFVTGISPATAASMRTIPGVPIYVELNFRRFKKVAVLRLKDVAFDSKGEDDALKVSSFMFRAPFGSVIK